MYDEWDGHKFVYSHLKPNNLYSTTTPYWSDSCGISITNMVDMEYSINKMNESYSSFTPRQYILDTLSPKVCMQRILDYFHLAM